MWQLIYILSSAYGQVCYLHAHFPPFRASSFQPGWSVITSCCSATLCFVRLTRPGQGSIILFTVVSVIRSSLSLALSLSLWCPPDTTGINLSTHRWSTLGSTERWKLCVCSSGLMSPCVSVFVGPVWQAVFSVCLSPLLTCLFLSCLCVCVPLIDISQSTPTWVMCARSGLWREKLFISHHMAMPPGGQAARSASYHCRDIVLPSDGPR